MRGQGWRSSKGINRFITIARRKGSSNPFGTLIGTCRLMGKEEVLRQVREAEQSVRDMIEHAERERDQKQTASRREADRILEKGLVSMDEQIEAELNKSAAETKRMVDTRIDQGRGQVERDRVDSERRLPRAADRLVEELEGSIVS